MYTIGREKKKETYYIMKEFFELIMLICFGLSWPISVYKSVKSKSTQGKSAVFILAIIVGYVSGITSKLIDGQLTYVFILYCINLFVVCVDLILFFINRHREKLAAQTANGQAEDDNVFSVTLTTAEPNDTKNLSLASR